VAVKSRALLRAALAVAIPLVLLGIGRALGLHERFSVDGVRATVHGAGAWGALIFVASFCAGELVHVPGLVFVAAGVLLYGREAGGVASYAGALVSISVTFGVVRGIGGRALDAVESARFRRLLDKLDARPVRTIALLRLVFILSPPLNYALALSRVRFRDYLLGSALGLLPPTALAVVFFDRVLAWVG
jgi:uncharacterized membrane protein YdjX (TVP38/TMEM64 family)